MLLIAISSSETVFTAPLPISSTKLSRLSQRLEYWQPKPFRLKDQNLNSVDRIHICRNEIKDKNATLDCKFY